MNGRNVFMGYLNMKDKTLEAFDDDLWVRSGDIGKKDNDGFLFITGRIKGTHSWSRCLFMSLMIGAL